MPYFRRLVNAQAWLAITASLAPRALSLASSLSHSGRQSLLDVSRASSSASREVLLFDDADEPTLSGIPGGSDMASSVWRRRGQFSRADVVGFISYLRSSV